MFIPLLYFTQGVPYVLVNVFSVAMYNKLGVSNDQIGLWTSLIALPWTLKMLWAPMVDLTLTKRRWILITQGLMAAGIAAAAWGSGLPSFLPVTLAIFALLAFLSATHDIAADGFYLLALDQKNQAFFVGVRSTFFRLAMIFGSGLLVSLAGLFLETKSGTGFKGLLLQIDAAAAGMVPDATARAWVLALGFGALVYGIVFLLNSILLPRPASDAPRKTVVNEPTARISWWEAVSTFFKQPGIGWILAFILFYRFGEVMISKMAIPFLQDTADKGGLGIATTHIGVINGTIGVLGLTFGGILGGMVISKFGIKRSLWPMVLALNIPNLFYLWAALTKPGVGAVTTLVAVDQFGYGFGFSAYMVYLMFISQGSKYETSHYAIATGLMALGVMVAGMVSGFLQVQLGYAAFFGVVVLSAIPGIITLLKIPLEKEDIYHAQVDID